MSEDNNLYELLEEDDIEYLKQNRKEAIRVLLDAGMIVETEPESKVKKFFKNFWEKVRDATDEKVLIENKDAKQAKVPEKDYHNPKLGTHEVVARRVFRRLLLRNAQLSLLTDLTKKHFQEENNGQAKARNDTDIGTNSVTKVESEANINSNKTIKCVTSIKPDGTVNIERNDEVVQMEISEKNKPNDLGLHAYRHAITDLFVEKAITYLEIQADKYQSKGTLAYILGLGAITISFLLAGFHFVIIKTNLLKSYFQNSHLNEPYDTISTFVVSFTLYGFLVLLAVGCWRFGRAMLDQAERLLERRHALRQGRLFVHLHDGNMTIEDMEKAFNWNLSNNNAFTHMSTDAKAPWGAVASEAIKASADLLKSSKDINDSIKKSNK